MERTFETPEPVELTVQLGGGSVTTEATDTDTTTVTVEGPRADDFIVEHVGRRVLVSAPRGRGLFAGRDDHDVHVTLPAGSDLIAKVGSADVRAEGEYGALRVQSGSGDVEVDTVRGNAVLDSGSGDLAVDRIGAQARIKTGSGGVEIGAVAGDAVISTGSGDVDLGHPGSDVVVKTGSGDTIVRRHGGGDLQVSTGSGDIRVDHAANGRLRGKTASGDIVVAVPAGVPVWTDATSATGKVRVELPSVGKPEEGQDHLEVRAHTATGDVLFRLA